MTEPNHFWRKIALVLLPFVIAGAVAAIGLRNDVKHLEQAVDVKADRAVVAAQYEAILRELQSLRADLAQLRGR